MLSLRNTIIHKWSNKMGKHKEKIQIDRKLFGQNLKEIRNDLGLTQKEFCEQLTIKQSRLGAVEEGRTELRISDLFQIYKIYGITFDELVKGF